MVSRVRGSAWKNRQWSQKLSGKIHGLHDGIRVQFAPEASVLARISGKAGSGRVAASAMGGRTVSFRPAPHRETLRAAAKIFFYEYLDASIHLIMPAFVNRLLISGIFLRLSTVAELAEVDRATSPG